MERADTDANESDRQRRRRLLREAAIEAEYDTGVREATEALAKRSILKRLAVITLGMIVLTAGLTMIVLPGPGIVVSLTGLGILATEVQWADRLLKYLRERSKVDEVTKLPLWTQVGIGLFSLAALSSSVVYLLVIK